MYVIRELTPISRSSKGTVRRKNPIVLLSMENQQKTEKRAVEEGVGNNVASGARSVMNVPMLSLRGKKWTYRGEGNANVVIALPQERKVIRLRKSSKDGLYSHGESATFSLEAKFYTNVMIPLLGSCYVNPPAIISIDRQEILELEDQLDHQRPVSRLHKGIQSVDAAVYMDYALLPANLKSDSSGTQRFSTFCIEIKPKQGWVPKPDRQLHKCKFCLHQYLKVMTQKVENHSQYCPLDLFSGNPWQMKKALCALLETPQNNLKIFQDGTLVYGQGINGSALSILKEWLGGPSNIHDHKKLLEKFCFVLVEALTRDMTSNKKSYEKVSNDTANCYISLFGNEKGDGNKVNGSACLRYLECDIVSHKSDIEGHVTEEVERVPADLIRAAKSAAVHALKSGKEFCCQWATHEQDRFPENCVLERVLRVQKLDTCGADHVYREYHELNLMGKLPNFSYIPSLMATDSALSPIHRYLLATTAKDCSIMVTFQEELDSRIINLHKQSIIQCPDGQKLLFNIGIIDLEPKPLSCIDKHVLRDCEVLKAYVNWQVALNH